MRTLSSIECTTIVGGTENTSDTSQLLSAEGVGLLSGIGIAGGGILGARTFPWPIPGAIIGAMIGSTLPIVIHVVLTALIQSYEHAGLL